MSKLFDKDSPVLPDIDEQIKCITHLRREVIPCIPHLRIEKEMILAIEQTLIASKINAIAEVKSAQKKNRYATNDQCIQILNTHTIRITSIRIDVLKSIFRRKDSNFTISEVYQDIRHTRPVSKSAVLSNMILFRARGLIKEEKKEKNNNLRSPGRPKANFIYIQQHHSG